jgi:hypothetical protein
MMPFAEPESVIVAEIRRRPEGPDGAHQSRWLPMPLIVP